MRFFQYTASIIKRKRFDWFFKPVVLRKNAIFLFLIFLIFRRFWPGYSIQALSRAHRHMLKDPGNKTHTLWLRKTIENCIIREFSKKDLIPLFPRENEMVSEKMIDLFRQRGLVLKAPRFLGDKVIEKGALLLKFTEQFLIFRKCVDVASVLQHYVLTLEPSWSGHSNLNILYFTRFSEQPIVVMAADKRDRQFLRKLGSNLIPVSFGPGAWVNPSVFRPLENYQKRFDAIMVARWATYKRHHALFRALKKIGDPNFKVALVANPWPRKRKDIELLLDFYGVSNNVNIFEALTHEEVNEMLNASKVNLVLSFQEGDNRSLSEGFCAGTPGIALWNNTGISKDRFNAQTGKLIDEKDLSSELLYFQKHWSEFRPRRWALENITPEITTSKLNRLLKDLAKKRGEEWTTDIVCKCNSPELKYYPDENAGKGLPAMEDIILQYGRSEEIRHRIHRI
jgi:glycosyltransferase involved in cell wall biosynthesis